MADVFISYHETSAGTLAQQIAATLESWGITCWYAKRDMPFGADFAGEIPKQINDCKLFLLLLNKGACQSLYVPNELALAFQRSRDIHILPLKIGEFQEPDWVSFFLVLIQWIPFPAQPDAQELHRLAARVAQLLNRRPTPPQPAKAPIASKVKSMSEKLAPLSVLSLGQKVKKALIAIQIMIRISNSQLYKTIRGNLPA